MSESYQNLRRNNINIEQIFQEIEASITLIPKSVTLKENNTTDKYHFRACLKFLYQILANKNKNM